MDNTNLYESPDNKMVELEKKLIAKTKEVMSIEHDINMWDVLEIVKSLREKNSIDKIKLIFDGVIW
jgi:hypothetical protein